MENVTEMSRIEAAQAVLAFQKLEGALWADFTKAVDKADWKHAQVLHDAALMLETAARRVNRLTQ